MSDTDQLTHGHRVSDRNARIKNYIWGCLLVLRGSAVMVAVLAGLIAFRIRADPPWQIMLGLVAVGGAIGYWFGFNEYAKGVGTLAPRRQTTATGAARMGQKKDLEQDGLIGKHADNDQNICCGELEDGTEIFYSGERHVGIVGPSGYGKDTGYCFTNLKRLNRPIVVFDAKGGEMAAVTARWRERFGPVVSINPYQCLTGSHPHLESDGFNPLAGLDPDAPEFFANSNAIGEAAVEDQGKDNTFFVDGARALISLCIMTVAWQVKKGILKRAATLDDVNEMLMLPHTSTDDDAPTLQNSMRVLTKHHDKQVRRAAGRYIADNKTNLSVITTAITAMNNLNDRMVAADLEKTPIIHDKRFPAIDGKPFNFGMLRDHPITVFVILPEGQRVFQAVWMRLMVASAINGITRDVPSTKSPILLINEAGNLGKLGSLLASMSMGRGKFTLITIWQTMSQIRNLYGEDGVNSFMQGWGFKAFFACKDPYTA